MKKVYEGNEPYVFVSYSHKDSEKVEATIQMLQRAACNIWYDTGITAGTSWSEDVAAHLEKSSLMLVFITSSSIESSYVNDEIHFARKKGIPIQPCYLEDVTLTSELELLIGRIEARHCFSESVRTIYDTVKSALPEKVFHKSGKPFYVGKNNMFFIRDISTYFPENAYFGGEKDCAFEITFQKCDGEEEVVLWRHKEVPMREIVTLSITSCHLFEDPYFDEAETDVVIFNLIINMLTRYPAPHPDVALVLTIGITDIDAEMPKLVGINCKAYDLENKVSDEQGVAYSNALAESILKEVNATRMDK